MSSKELPQQPLFPAEGTAGAFRMLMYRGIRATPLNSTYASDPGDYGRGLYWSNRRETAELYAAGGQIIEGVVELRHAMRLSPKEVTRYGREVYGFTVLEKGSDARIAAAERFTADMKAAGYDGVVTYGYESFHEWGACVF